MKFEHNLPTKVKIVDREKYFLEISRDKKILHLGCVDQGLTKDKQKFGTWLHEKLVQISSDIVELDYDKSGIEILQKNYPNMKFVLANMEELDKDTFSASFDIIIGGEVIEHLLNVGKFFESMNNIMDKNCKLILTTPNAFRYRNLLLSIFKKEAIHPDHNYWFSWSSLNTILNKFGFRIEKTFLYNIYPKFSIKPEDNIICKFKKLGFRIIDTVITKIVIPFVPFWADGLIVVVVKKKSITSR